MAVTNRGKKLIFDGYFRETTANGRSVGGKLPQHFYIHLCTSAATPTVDTNTLTELTQIVNGQGYSTNGYELVPGTADFDSLVEDDAADKALLQIKDLIWTASGGSMPASGNGARWAVMCDDQAVVADRNVIAFWDLVSDRSISDGQTLTLQNCEIDGTE